MCISSCVVKCSENSVRFENLMGIDFQKAQILLDFVSQCEILHVSNIGILWWISYLIPQLSTIVLLHNKLKNFKVNNLFLIINFNNKFLCNNISNETINETFLYFSSRFFKADLSQSI